MVSPPLVFWSPTLGLVWQEDGTYLCRAEHGDSVVEFGFAQPADAVELVPQTEVKRWRAAYDAEVRAHGETLSAMPGRDAP